MFKTKLAALLAASLLSIGAAAAGESPAKSPASNDPPLLALVDGLRPDDLLNVRATASPTGIVLGRLPPGSAVRNFGCGQFNGYKWCNVDALDVPGLSGWSPGRYLRAPGKDEAPDLAAKAAAAASFVAARPMGPSKESAAVAAPIAAEVSSATGADASSGGGKMIAAPPGAKDAATAKRGGRLDAAAMPALQERFGQGSGKAPPALPPESLSARMGGAEASAGTAASDNPTTGEIYSLGLAEEARADDPAPAAEPMPEPLPQVTEAAPSPAPRAEPVPPPPPEPQVVAQLQPAAATVDAAGEIPCARYVGQPMTRCAAEVAQSGADAVDVTVNWPDGGKRIIRFRAGKPEGANSRGEFRFTREGDLSMIRIGLAERFEVPDSLLFGE